MNPHCTQTGRSGSDGLRRWRSSAPPHRRQKRFAAVLSCGCVSRRVSIILHVMSILRVARMGHPVLRTKARPLEKAAIRTPEVQKLIDDMLETMREYHGVGLAAPQVHEALRIFVAALDADDEENEHPEPIAVVNPEITIVDAEIVSDWEGCLSIPDIRGKVPRARAVRL